MDWSHWLRRQPVFRDLSGGVALVPHGAVLRFEWNAKAFALRPSAGERSAYHARLASHWGWGPEWVTGDGDGFVVRWWNEGRTPETSEQRRTVERMLAGLHRSGAPFRGNVGATAALHAGRARWEATGRPLPDFAVREWDRWISLAAELESSALRVPLHGDVHPGNVLIRGEEVRLIDWEFAGLGDPDWDLGYWSVRSGSPPPNRRAEQYGILADAAWRLWLVDKD